MTYGINKFDETISVLESKIKELKTLSTDIQNAVGDMYGCLNGQCVEDAEEDLELATRLINRAISVAEDIVGEADEAFEHTLPKINKGIKEEFENLTY